MISSDIEHFRAPRGHPDDLSEHFEVGRGEIPFAELPNVNDVPVQDQLLGLDAIQISNEFVGVTTVGP